MIKKNFLLIIIFCVFFVLPNYAKTALRDELPNLKRLNDYSIGERRVFKALKYEARGKFKKANRLYSEALDYFLLANEQTPVSLSIYFYLGFTSEKLKKISDAEIYYLLGLEIDPNNTKINNYLGQFYFKNNKVKEANEILKVLEACLCEDYNELKNVIK
jgi:tetratricopeptide (TPR) repeat protein